MRGSVILRGRGSMALVMGRRGGRGDGAERNGTGDAERSDMSQKRTHGINPSVLVVARPRCNAPLKAKFGRKNHARFNTV